MEKWQEAYEDCKKGFKYKEIADKYGVSESTVKSWAQRKWKKLGCDNSATLNQKVTESCSSDNKKVAKTKKKILVKNENKKGAPTGNKNAVGNSGGAPVGNTNSVKHGLFAKINTRTLTKEEQEYILGGNIDAGKELEIMSRLSDIRNMRLFEKMTETEKAPKGLILGGMTVSQTKGGNSNETETKETRLNSADEMMLKYNNAIISNDRLKIKCLEILSKLNESKPENFGETINIYIPNNEREV